MRIRQATLKHMDRQRRIAAMRGISVPAGRFKKQNAADCGRPRCGLCGNPRRIRKERTLAELRADERFAQELREGVC